MDVLVVAVAAASAGVAIGRIVLAAWLSRFRTSRRGIDHAVALAQRAGLEIRIVSGREAAYWPAGREILLSRPVSEGQDVWSAAVAAHEVGHALDHRSGFPGFALVAGSASNSLLFCAWGCAGVMLVLGPFLGSVAPSVAAVALLAGLPLACLELVSECRASRWALAALAGELPRESRGPLLARLGLALATHALPAGLWSVAAVAAVGAVAGPVSVPALAPGLGAVASVWLAVVLHYRRTGEGTK